MIVVVPVDPPRDGLVLSSLTEQTPLSPAEARRLYEASTEDVLRAVASSGGDVLVNYRDEGTLPDASADGASEADVRALAVDALGEAPRTEVQVGSTRSARMGNTVTHLLNREDAASVAVVEPTATLVGRTEIDGAAMSLRSKDVLVGPSTGGSVYLAGFSEPIDFTDVYTAPELTSLARRAREDGLEVGIAPAVPTIATEAGLCETIAGLEARRTTPLAIPEATAAVLEDLNLTVEAGPTLVRQ